MSKDPRETIKDFSKEEKNRVARASWGVRRRRTDYNRLLLHTSFGDEVLLCLFRYFSHSSQGEEEN